MLVTQAIRHVQRWDSSHRVAHSRGWEGDECRRRGIESVAAIGLSVGFAFESDSLEGDARHHLVEIVRSHFPSCPLPVCRQQAWLNRWSQFLTGYR